MKLPFPIADRYNRFNRFLREKFGEKVYRICLDAGFTCPTRDGTLGTKGCVYCNNTSFGEEHRKNLLTIPQQMETGITRLYEKRKIKKYLAYFQSYTNTYSNLKYLEKIYKESLNFPGVVGLLIGTRPDCINNKIINLLQELNKSIFVSLEIGIESVYDKTLKWAERGHNFEQTIQSIKMAKDAGLHVCGHYILGFPTENRHEILSSVDILNNLKIDAIKLHHLHIVKKSKLAEIYLADPFPLFSEQEWIYLICDFLERLNPSIVIHQNGNWAKPKY